MIRLIPTCDWCGSHGIHLDAVATWNHRAQAWQLWRLDSAAPTAHCVNCNGETSFTMKPAEEVLKSKG